MSRSRTLQLVATMAIALSPYGATAEATVRPDPPPVAIHTSDPPIDDGVEGRYWIDRGGASAQATWSTDLGTRSDEQVCVAPTAPTPPTPTVQPGWAPSSPS